MKYKLVVRPEAERDIERAFDWYEDPDRGLGEAFILALRSSISIVLEMPHLYPIVSRKTRRCLLDGFPYSIFYIAAENEITVTACIHQRRSPRVWKSRK